MSASDQIKYTGQTTPTPHTSYASLICSPWAIVITTIALAIQFIIFALYVNPILKLVKLLFRALQRFWAFMYKAALSTFAALIILARLCLILCMNIKHLGTFVWFCSVQVWRLPSQWRPIYRWVKEFRRAKKEAKIEGQDWEKRQYVAKYLLKR
jgi:hypothetical protein